MRELEVRRIGNESSVLVWGGSYNPPRNLTSGSPSDNAPHPRSNVGIRSEVGSQIFFSTGLRAATNIASWGAGSEMDDAKKPEVKFLGGRECVLAAHARSAEKGDMN